MICAGVKRVMSSFKEVLLAESVKEIFKNQWKR